MSSEEADKDYHERMEKSRQHLKKDMMEKAELYELAAEKRRQIAKETRKAAEEI